MSGNFAPAKVDLGDQTECSATTSKLHNGIVSMQLTLLSILKSIYVESASSGKT